MFCELCKIIAHDAQDCLEGPERQVSTELKEMLSMIRAEGGRTPMQFNMNATWNLDKGNGKELRNGR